jgi:hypothetical protein
MKDIEVHVPNQQKRNMVVRVMKTTVAALGAALLCGAIVPAKADDEGPRSHRMHDAADRL